MATGLPRTKLENHQCCPSFHFMWEETEAREEQGLPQSHSEPVAEQELGLWSPAQHPASSASRTPLALGSLWDGQMKACGEVCGGLSRAQGPLAAILQGQGARAQRPALGAAAEKSPSTHRQAGAKLRKSRVVAVVLV